MNSTDRTKPPIVKGIDKIDLINPAKYNLTNGVPVYVIKGGSQDVLMIEFIFKAGLWYQSELLTSRSTNKMLLEGTKSFTSEDIANKIDYYGAYVETETENDTASVTIYTLNKHLEKVLPIMEEIIKKPTFPENELTTFVQNAKQNFIINNEKVNYIARVKFNEVIFGENHPYGRNAVIEDFDDIERKRLNVFHEKYYTSDNCQIIVAGKVEKSCIDLLNCHFGNNEWASKRQSPFKPYSIKTATQKKHVIEKKDALQSSIRIGKAMINKTHPDYIGLKVLNTALGGYFGSRLMTNIREDKGYTYGIGSALVSFHHSGMFFITSEVGIKFCLKAIEEIYKELKRLRKETIHASELNLVKNYILGAFMRSVDGPFDMAGKLREALEYNLDNSYYHRFIAKVKEIKAKEIKELAEKYFQEETMLEVIAGKIK